MRKALVFSILALFLVAACSPNAAEGDFFTSTAQDAETRLIEHQIVAIDSFNMFDTYDISLLNDILVNNDTLLIPYSSKMRIVRINFDEPLIFEYTSFEKGEGPGELRNMQGIDTNESGLLIADSQQNKTVLFSTSDESLKEQGVAPRTPHRISWVTTDTYVILSPISHDKVFHVVSVSNGLQASFGTAVSPPNPLMYEGRIRATEDNLYYAGRSEPVLKKYTTQGDLVYSRATIDNFPTEGNYFTSEDPDFVMFRYTDWALYSTSHFTLSDAYWIVVPVPEEEFEETHQVIDLYHRSNGSYSHSIGLDRNLRLVALGTNYLFGIHITEDREYYLVRYPNIFSGDDGAFEE